MNRNNYNWQPPGEKQLKSLCSYIAFHMNESNMVLPTPGYFDGRLSDIETEFVLVAAVDAIINSISTVWSYDADEWPTHTHMLFLAAVEVEEHLQNWNNINDSLVQLMVAVCKYFAEKESITPDHGRDFMHYLPWHS